MGFRSGAYATVWGVEAGRGNFLTVQLSVSKKNKQTGEYEQDFSGFVNFIGYAKTKAMELQPKDRIQLKDVDVTTTYNKEKKITYTNYACFDFDKVSQSSTNVTVQAEDPTPKNSALEAAEEGILSEDGCPF